MLMTYKISSVHYKNIVNNIATMYSLFHMTHNKCYIIWLRTVPWYLRQEVLICIVLLCGAVISRELQSLIFIYSYSIQLGNL